jgi:hypothetical protein
MSADPPRFFYNLHTGLIDYVLDCLTFEVELYIIVNTVHLIKNY